jgi:glycosyltransferase involved in cell wall biosynthesis
VLLVGNYAADRQHSMLLFGEALAAGASERGWEVTQTAPNQVVGCEGKRCVGKWLAYVDKYVLFPKKLRRVVSEFKKVGGGVAHIVDHSNAMYGAACAGVPVLVTCHDVGAIRGALGTLPVCRATWMGKWLQRWIMAGLRKADRVACVSEATQADLLRTVPGIVSDRVGVVSNGLNRSFAAMDRAGAQEWLKARGKWLSEEYLLNVGSGLERKNREGVLRIFDRWRRNNPEGRLVFAGARMEPGLRRLAERLGVADRVVEVESPSTKELEAWYRCAFALVFPTRFEGFGWPVIEAQACGCPVVASDNSAVPEAAGGAALLRDVEDEEGMAADLERLRDPTERRRWVEAGQRNAARFSMERMVTGYLNEYENLLRGARPC